MLFLLMFRGQPGALLAASIAVALIAQASDHLDGYLARRRGPPPATGWLFDGVCDRAFYFAALLAFHREYGLPGLLIWLFILRELNVYVLRIAIGEFGKRRPGYRLLTLVHAGLVRLAIALGCAMPYWFASPELRQASLLALTSLLALATAFGYSCLALVLRSPGPDEAIRRGGNDADGPGRLTGPRR
jgi:CDP-diacylglycerol--glycerol-3-phosphate 3-phosphatidyltransferase